ncbi:ADP-ribosylglycohydrolase family protein [Myxosarcina sp. GI1]|uniref:ADP-ribosylglycohydrolase family protein n=1 Tax=Myxosarcina sp. GI1 TaxID=1541065 RepID=UPI00055F7E43|nr:ADP-ribosylglycohydrolase family protein [Myxosarcina sp. GI1]
MNQNTYDKALGCLLGALVGDAAGATLEFLGRAPNIEEVTWAMSMPGGGVIGVAPGQITDDGELTLCQAKALAESEKFNLEAIARNYAKWVDSNPFDVGITTSNSLGSYSQPQWREIFQQQGYAATMKTAAAKQCMGSKANGSLMRITPLAIWGKDLATDELADFARQDSALSHPNPSCGYAVACYCIAIAHLLDYSGDCVGAFESAKSWLDSQNPKTENSFSERHRAEVSSWLDDAANNRNVPYYPQAGFIKIAFTQAFRHLLLGSDYQTAIAETLLGGGDTDTNACIVGGLIGAACGAESIPQTMRDRILNCDTRQGKHPRPDFFHPKQIHSLIEKLLSN